MKYRLAIFDFDGTLADSLPWFRSVFNSVATRYGFRALDDAEFEELRGMGNREIIRRVGVPLWKIPLIAAHMKRLMAEDIDGIALVRRGGGDAAGSEVVGHAACRGEFQFGKEHPAGAGA